MMVLAAFTFYFLLIYIRRQRKSGVNSRTLTHLIFGGITAFKNPLQNMVPSTLETGTEHMYDLSTYTLQEHVFCWLGFSRHQRNWAHFELFECFPHILAIQVQFC